MEFIKQLAAFASEVSVGDGPLVIDPDSLAGIWIKIINSLDETTMISGLSAPAQDLYRQYEQNYFGGLPAVLQEPEPEPEPGEYQAPKDLRDAVDKVLTEETSSPEEVAHEPEKEPTTVEAGPKKSVRKRRQKSVKSD